MNPEWSPPDGISEKLGGRLDLIRCDPPVADDHRAPRISVDWLPFANASRHPLPEAGLLPPADAADGLPWQLERYRKVGPWHVRAVVGCYAWRHASRITSVAISPDGRVAISGSVDASARLWDTRTGREIRTLAPHSGIVSAVAISPDGRLAVTGSNDETVAIHHMATGRVERTIDLGNTAVTHVTWLPDRTTLLVALDDGTMQLHNIVTGQLVGELVSGTYNPVVAVRITPDERLALTGTADGSIGLWNLQSFRELRNFVGEQSPPGAITFGADSRHAYTGLGDGRVRMRDVSNGREVQCVADGSGGITALAVSPDGALVASGTANGEVRLRRTDGSGDGILRHVGASVTCLVFSPDSQHLLAGRTDGGLAMISPVDASPGWPRGALNSPPLGMDAVRDVAVVIARCDPATQPRLWQIDQDGDVQQFAAPIDQPRCVAASRDGARLLIGGLRAARLWDVEHGSPGPLLGGHESSVTAVAFSPDGQHALTGEATGDLRVWSLARETPRLLRHIPVVSGEVTGLAFAGEQHPMRVVSLTVDATLRVHDGATGEELALRRGHDGGGSVAVSPDCQYLLTGGRDGVALYWNLDAMLAGGTFSGAWFHDRRVLAVRYSADGTMFHTLSAGAWRTFTITNGVPSDVALPPEDDPLGFAPALDRIPDDVSGGVLSPDGSRLLLVTARNVVIDYSR